MRDRTPPKESSSLILGRVKALFKFYFCNIRLSFSFPLVMSNQKGIMKPTLGERHLIEEPQYYWQAFDTDLRFH